MNSTQTDTMDDNLSLAIKISTAEQANKAINDFVECGSRTWSESKKAAKTSMFLLPNWKFNSNKSADQFEMLAIALLQKVTKEKFHSCRFDTGHEGHLFMMLGCGVTEEEFLKLVDDF